MLPDSVGAYLLHPCSMQHGSVLLACILTSSIRMVNSTWTRPSDANCHSKRSEH